MENQPLMENLRNVYVLLETHQLLTKKFEEMKEQNLSVEIVKDDLRKIEEELKEYTGEEDLNKLESFANDELIFPHWTDY